MGAMTPERWQRIKAVYQAALDHDDFARAAFLTEACAGDQDLRHEVESLLNQSVSEHQSLDGAARDATFVWNGQRLGTYHVLELLGAGGMGEVYRAHDSKLGRDVAIKILPPIFTRSAERIARFEREARVLAALNHPHVAAIYGVEEAEGVRALILELVEGETLGDRIGRGPLPVTEALALARQIADAVHAAHKLSIVHRDLKPANIKITSDGVVKVLDFGLAKAVAGDNTPGLSPPTLTVGDTRAGVVLGTAPYMSPEQARGTPVDSRADVWAFGCILFEMLTGQRAFEGETVSDTIAKILEREPPWTALPRSTPARVRRLVRRCLEKDSTRRLQDLGEARVALDRALATRAQSAGWRPAAAAAIALAAIGALVWLRPDPRAALDPSHWEQLTNFPDSATQPALSPDGRMLAFIRGPGTFLTVGQIYLKLLPDGEPVALTRDDDVVKMSPVFSPAGTHIAYRAHPSRADSGDTWIVPVVRGEPRHWLRNASGLTWIGSGRILFSEVKAGLELYMGIITATEDRTNARDVYSPPGGRGQAHRSALSPDGEWVLIVERDRFAVWMPCRLVPFQGGLLGEPVGPPRARCSNAAWSPDGKWMYFSADTSDGFHIWRQRFPGGSPEQVTFGPTEQEGLAIAPDGQSLITSVGLQRRGVWVHDASGERQISSEGNAFWPLFSADARKLLYRISRGASTGQAPTELWITDLALGRTERLFPGQLVTQYDVSRDGHVVAAVLEADGKSRLWLASLDGRSEGARIPFAEGGAPRFASADEILFLAEEGDARYIFRIRKDGSGRARASSTPVRTAVIGMPSPDGEWLTSSNSLDEKSRAMVALSTRGADPVTIFRSANESRLRWSADGKRVYLSIQTDFGAFAMGRTYVLPVQEGSMLPRVPAGGFRSEAELAAVPGVEALPHGDVALGPTPGVYAFSRIAVARNLYRIPLP
jgi:Tol biopolymer transport system component